MSWQAYADGNSISAGCVLRCVENGQTGPSSLSAGAALAIEFADNARMAATVSVADATKAQIRLADNSQWAMSFLRRGQDNGLHHSDWTVIGPVTG